MIMSRGELMRAKVRDRRKMFKIAPPIEADFWALWDELSSGLSDNKKKKVEISKPLAKSALELLKRQIARFGFMPVSKAAKIIAGTDLKSLDSIKKYINRQIFARRLQTIRIGDEHFVFFEQIPKDKIIFKQKKIRAYVKDPKIRELYDNLLRDIDDNETEPTVWLMMSKYKLSNWQAEKFLTWYDSNE